MAKRSQEAIQLENKTASSFGFEWSKFSDIYAAYESNFLSYTHPLGREFFHGKKTIDAGCGAGRHTYFLAQYGAEVTAFDFSPGAVQTTKRNTANYPNVNVVKANIYQLPEAWQGDFDCVVCLGVLHHLPDPQKGFHELVKLLRQGGTIAIWVYGRADNRLSRFVYAPLRLLTTRIPHKVLYYLALVPAGLVETANCLRLPLFRHYRPFPFRAKWNDAFDVLSAPQSQYYNLAEINGWFEEEDLKDTRVEYRILDGKKKGIRGIGTR